jgi:hypothetical protein
VSFPATATAVVTTDQLSTTLGDDVVILGLRNSVYYGLSNVGTRLWHLLQTPRRIDDLVAVIVSEYEVAPEQAADDLQRLLADLERQGLVAITAADPS